jgi:superfamily II DNA or RNA helicase
MRLGALELLANIFSGRITASDKDPFPHQLALQQYMKSHQTQVQRLLIADEVGLGKTIEVGLVLRDLLVAQGYSRPLRCLYLTKGGLLDDVKLKLQSVIPGVDGESIVQVEKSFVEYGNRTDGIHIASMDAARRYVKKVQKKKLPTGVSPEILIIDEAHHCASEDDLTSPQRIGLKATTRAMRLLTK